MKIKTYTSYTILNIRIMWEIKSIIQTDSDLIYSIICNKTWELRYINSDLVDVSYSFQKSFSKILH